MCFILVILNCTSLYTRVYWALSKSIYYYFPQLRRNTYSLNIKLMKGPILLTLASLLFAMWKACSSLSFLKTGAGKVSIKFPFRFKTVRCTRQSTPSIFEIRLLAKWSSLSGVKWSSFSIFSIMWLFRFK